jgi:heptosyltransferase-2
MPRQKRILIVRPDRVGDVVMITPMIRELRRTFPDAFIGTLTQPHTSQILLHNPQLDVRITDDMEKDSFWTVVREIRSYKFTHALLVMPTERAAYQLFLAGIPYRTGVGHKLYEIITLMRSVSRNNYIPLRHEADFCMDLARKIGVTTTNIQPELFVSPDEKSAANTLLSSLGAPPENKRVLFHTGSRGSAPNWHEAEYAELLRGMFATYDLANVKILLTAAEMSDAFIRQAKEIGGDAIIPVADKLPSLRDFICAISVCDLMICSSTGPIHLADGLDIPCVGLHCCRPMSCSTHWGVINKKSVNLDAPAALCAQHCSTDQNTCSLHLSLPVATVLNSLKQFLSKK